MSFVKPSVLLCVCLVLASRQAAAGESALRLTRATSQVNELNTVATFTLEFTAAQEPQILWWQTNRDDPYEATTTFSEGHGSTEVELPITGPNSPRIFRIFLAIGDHGGQFFETGWVVPASKNVDQTLELDQVKVEPGTDLLYKNEDEVAVKVTMSYLNGYRMEFGTDLNPFGKWIDPTTGNVTMDEYPMIPFLKLTEATQQSSHETTLTFNTDEVKVNGLFEARIFYSVHSKDLPIQYMSDRILLLVHEDKEGAPSAEDLVRTLESH